VRRVISKDEAIRLGLVRYFTGEPCKRGHIDDRYVANNGCRSCILEKGRDYYTPEKGRAKNERFKKDNPEYFKRHYQDNKPRYNAQSRAWRRDNREASNAIVRRYSKRNPDYWRANNHNRRAREREAEGFFRPTDIKEIRRKQKDRCAYCRKNLKGKGSVDHIQPLSSGGTNWPKNLQLLCISCNCKKRDKCPTEFASELGRLL
jgi:hypothetical protein